MADDADHLIIAEWRRTADSGEADAAELQLLRTLAANQRAADELWSRCRGDKRAVTQGALDHALFLIGQEVALRSELTRRQHRKAVDALQAELQQVQNFCIHLQHRLAAVEAETRRDVAGADAVKFGRAIAA